MMRRWLFARPKIRTRDAIVFFVLRIDPVSITTTQSSLGKLCETSECLDNQRVERSSR